MMPQGVGTDQADCMIPSANLGALGEAGATEGGRDGFVVTAAGTQEMTEFTMFATEAMGCFMALEATHTQRWPRKIGQAVKLGSL
jgi:hypothetical protein